MKKLYFLAIAVILIGIYTNLSNESIPAAVEKKVIYDENEGKTADTMPVIRVMTYNIHRGINKDNELDLDGIAEVIKSSGAEMVALQEVERFSLRTRFEDQIGYISDKLSMYYAFGKSMNILNGQYGNAILSKYPIEEYEVSKLPSNGEQRTLLRAGINMNGHRISMYSTHLGLEQGERDLQVEEILKITGDDKNFIIAGDFNTKADKLYQVTRRYKDSAGYNDENKATFEAGGLSERIDYIFTSKEFEVQGYDVLKSDASDHYPVISTLKLKK